MTAALGVIPSRLLTGAEHGSGILTMPKVAIACFSNNLRVKALSPERRSAESVELKYAQGEASLPCASRIAGFSVQEVIRGRYRLHDTSKSLVCTSEARCRLPMWLAGAFAAAPFSCGSESDRPHHDGVVHREGTAS